MRTDEMRKHVLILITGLIVGSVIVSPIWVWGLLGGNESSEVEILPVKESLVLAVIPSDDPTTTRADWEPVVEYLEKGLNRYVELHIVPDYTSLVSAMQYGWVDVARMSAKGYIQVIEEGAKVEPVAKGVKATTGKPGYYGYIVARTDRQITDLTGLSFAFVDVGSTSGYVVPSVYIEREGIELGEIFIANSHEAVMLAVLNGTVDAGATACSRYDAALKEGIIEEGELEILWESPLIPNPPIVIQSSMDGDLKKLVAQLFLDMPQELVESLKGLNETGYVEATDSDYDPIREIMGFAQ